jgi:glycerate kinase
VYKCAASSRALCCQPTNTQIKQIMAKVSNFLGVYFSSVILTCPKTGGSGGLGSALCVVMSVSAIGVS